MSIISSFSFSLFCCTFVVIVVVDDDDFSFWTVVVAVVSMLTVLFCCFSSCVSSGFVFLKGTFSCFPELLVFTLLLYSGCPQF